MPVIGIQNASVSLKFGKRKQRSQMCELFTDDGRLLTVEHDVLRGCIDDPLKGMGFIIDGANQFLDEQGNWVQLLGERSTIPICPVTISHITDLKALKGQIFHESHEESKVQQYKKAAQSEFMNKILWMITIPCVTFLIIFGVQKLGS